MIINEMERKGPSRRAVCIISFSPIGRDARVLRQVKYLSALYDLIVIGFGDPHPSWEGKKNITWIPLSVSKEGVKEKDLRPPPSRPNPIPISFNLNLLRGWLYDKLYWRKSYRNLALEKALLYDYQAIHANDWEALPVASEAAQKKKAYLIFDAHEYAPLEFENLWYWKWLYAPAIRYFIHRYAPQVTNSITVAPLIAQRYKKEFGLDPLVILNIPDYDQKDLPRREVDPQHIRLVHHGVANRDRRLEKMIETIALCEQRYTLHFILVGNDPNYLFWLKRLAEQRAPGRIFFHNPVPPEYIVTRIAEFDIGFYLLEPGSYNNRVALPNKFFDFIAAGLAVCIGPSPSMAEIVQEYGLGCVAKGFAPLDAADLLNQLDGHQLEKMRKAARKAAGRFDGVKEMGKLVDLYQRLFGG